MSSNKEKQVDKQPVTSQIQNPVIVPAPVVLQRPTGTHLERDEYQAYNSVGFNPVNPKDAVCRIHVPAGLTDRKVYLYVYCHDTAGSLGSGLLSGKVRFLRNSSPVGEFDWKIQNYGLASAANALNDSAFAPSNGFLGGDCWQYSVKGIFAGETGFSNLAPHTFNIECDKIVVDVKEIGTSIDAFRVFIACLSQ